MWKIAQVRHIPEYLGNKDAQIAAFMIGPWIGPRDRLQNMVESL